MRVRTSRRTHLDRAFAAFLIDDSCEGVCTTNEASDFAFCVRRQPRSEHGWDNVAKLEFTVGYLVSETEFKSTESAHSDRIKNSLS